MRRFPSDDPERRQWQNPEAILTGIGLSAGMVFADIGCGDGYFALPAARIAGPSGGVFAADINAAAVEALRDRAAAAGLGNIRAETKPAEEAIFCRGCADIVFFGIDLHDFADPEQVIRNAKIMLRPSGRLVDLDWKDEPMPVGPPLAKRFSREKARSMIEAAGFRVHSVADSGRYHYLIIAGK